VVCFDDDDYYPPERVSHAVYMLIMQGKQIAGCDKMYFYDVFLDTVYQFYGFIFNDTPGTHSTNNCMAYWRSYLYNHKYNPDDTYSEEESFTNKFSVPMVQLDSEKTVLMFSHESNTYNKRQLIYGAYYLPQDAKYLIKTNLTLSDFIKDKNILDSYKSIFAPMIEPKDSEFDIVYFTGGMAPRWSPLFEDLGGSEQAIKYLAPLWAAKGKKVVVYGNIVDAPLVYKGVLFESYLKCRFQDRFRTIIMWRYPGVYPYMDLFRIQAKKLIIDLHNHQNFVNKFIQDCHSARKNHIDCIMVKSEFHGKLTLETMAPSGPMGIGSTPTIISIPNGLRIDKFNVTPPNVSRNRFRMCYCSCYSRGLERILTSIWPLLYRLEPRLELHVYYGMELLGNKEFVDNMRMLLSQPGVMDHGRQPVEVINYEKHMSTFHLYYTDSLLETDCISIRESLVAGCIPIISNVNLFSIRDGIQIPWLPNDEASNKTVAESILGFIRLPEADLNAIRDKLSRSKTIFDWSVVADEWMKYI
jgi:hypothetical protein